MAQSSTSTSSEVRTVTPQLLRRGAIGGVGGGVLLFLIMAIYNAAKGMGFWAILNSCFAAFVFKSARMQSMTMPEPMSQQTDHPASMSTADASMSHAMTEGQRIVASHLVVGALLHVLVSAAAGTAFAVVLALLIRHGLTVLASPIGYVAGGVAGGAALYVVMMEIVAPHLNRTIVESTARAPFLLAHLAFGAVVGGYVWLGTVRPAAVPRG